VTKKIEGSTFDDLLLESEVLLRDDGSYDVVLFTRRQDDTVRVGEWRPITEPRFIDKSSAQRYAQHLLLSIIRATPDGRPIPTTI
jgi:hypothetical protein